jgi:hypothetical protein
MASSRASVQSPDRRAAARVPTALRGKLFPGALDCTVSDFNKTGARLAFAGRPAIGDRVTVVIWSSGLAFEAAVRWRSGDEVGVQFLHSRDLRRPVPDHMAEIQSLWRKRRPRFRRRQLVACEAIIDKRPEAAMRRAEWQSPRLAPDL